MVAHRSGRLSRRLYVGVMRFRRKPQGLQGLTPDRPGSRHPRSRGLRSGCGVAQPAAGRHHAPAELGRRPFQTVVRHRRGAGGDASPATARGALRGVVSLAVTSLVTNQFAKRVWKRPRPNRAVGAVGTAEPALPDVELAAVRTFRQCRRIRGRGRAGEPSRRTGTRPARRSGRLVPCRRRRALSGRRVRRLRHRRGRRRARCARIVPPIVPTQDPRRRSAAGGHSPTTRRRGRGAGDQPRVGQRHRSARRRRGA